MQGQVDGLLRSETRWRLPKETPSGKEVLRTNLPPLRLKAKRYGHNLILSKEVANLSTSSTREILACKDKWMDCSGVKHDGDCLKKPRLAKKYCERTCLLCD
uniref:ShKT domain-containing protein n=1 Tax=Ascaris lumbricoides TaxID=6252 RepID=A0A0M3IEG4_ASCLU